MAGGAGRRGAIRIEPGVTGAYKPHPATGGTVCHAAAEADQGTGSVVGTGEWTPEKNGGVVELRKGYKQTEAGVIPEEWDVKRLGDLGTVVRGGSPRPAGDPRYFNGNFIPWLTVASLTNIPENQLFVTGTV